MTHAPRTLASTAAALGFLCLVLPPVSAQAPTTYTGSDSTAGPGIAHPNTDIARGKFDVAASSFGTLTQLDFENSTLGDITFTTNGVGIVGTNNGGARGFGPGGVTTITASSNLLAGFNTTPGGSKFLELQEVDTTAPVTEVFTFNNADPITAFGATFTGVGTNNGVTMITFNDGTTQNEVLPGSSLGGTEFFGFTDAANGKSIKSITLGVYPQDGASFDVIGIDDVLLYNGVPSKPTLGTVPEPAETLTMTLGLGMLGGLVLLARKCRIARTV